MYIIAYDIENDRLRTRTANKLLATGCIRLQFSVFAGELKGALFNEVETWLKKNVGGSKKPDNKVIVLNLGPEQLKSMQWIGSAPPEWELLIEPPDVLFI